MHFFLYPESRIKGTAAVRWWYTSFDSLHPQNSSQIDLNGIRVTCVLVVCPSSNQKKSDLIRVGHCQIW